MQSQSRQALIGLSLAVSSLITGQAMATTTVDVMLLYTPEAASKVKDINAHITNLVEYANQSYRNSEVDIKLRVVYSGQSTDVFGNVSSNTLKKFTDDQKIAGLRKQYGADLVTLITLREKDICGTAWVPKGNAETGKFNRSASGYGFNVIGAECGLLAYVHQLGHNMGLGHSAQNEKPSGRVGGIYPWARGHGVNGLFTTIMAYPKTFNGAKHVQQFSSPAQNKCKSQPCGIDKNNANGADAVENLKVVASQVASFVGTVKPNPDDDKEKPSKPTDLSGKVNKDNKTVILSWKDNSNNEEKFILQRKLKESSDWANLIELAADTTSYTDTAVLLDKHYDYRIKAANEIGDSDYSNIVSVIIKSSDKPDAGSGGPDCPGGDDNPDPGDDDKPNTDLCKKPHMANNLIAEGDFNSLNPWRSFHNSSVNLEKVEKQKSCGKDNILSIKNRKAFYDGVIQDITEKVKLDTEYEISAKMQIDSNQQIRGMARVALQITDEVGVHYQYLVNKSITSSEMSLVKNKFKVQALGELKKVQVLLFGPKSEYALNVDEVKLTQVGAEPPKPDKEVIKHDFELGLHGWIPFFGVDQVSRSKEVAGAGQYSMKVSGRSHWYSGPALDMKGLLESGKQYQFDLSARQAAGQTSEQLIDVQLFYVDDEGYHWHRVKTAKLPAGQQWARVSGDFSFKAKGNVQFIHLYLFGPEPGNDFFIDDINVKKK
ncbi:carbohydrate binding domain-containing protein [Endozoicomonas sp. SM1973]|uniref:endo-1,4-beta-xylanase n=1 Tax=Spartinivicinus marinus TaxID=2994442 RepID=A0A853I9S0_9GAMM|nr:carbohydrate binding domain-containing protein [Spartinivicinus marinus]MCX4026128.1 carbohydrate binding domain-containing protein [Spartinivicinus marinus]NYZ66611.1 carbohydrate binding domain-containing protein [Spartinivicinus marinus]